MLKQKSSYRNHTETRKKAEKQRNNWTKVWNLTKTKGKLPAENADIWWLQ